MHYNKVKLNKPGERWVLQEIWLIINNKILILVNMQYDNVASNYWELCTSIQLNFIEILCPVSKHCFESADHHKHEQVCRLSSDYLHNVPKCAIADFLLDPFFNDSYALSFLFKSSFLFVQHIYHTKCTWYFINKLLIFHN